MKLDYQSVKDDLKRLRSAKRRPKVFGADSHEYKMSPPLTEEAVQQFEQTHAIRLPEDYRQFLIEVGDGGAGPYYGIFKLGEIDDGEGHSPWQENDGFVGNLSEPFPHTQPWNDLTGQPHEEEFDNEEEFYKRFEAFEDKYFAVANVNGAFPICHEGCAYLNWLIVTGPERGHIWCDGRASDAGIYPVKLASKERVTFYDWYRHWLDEAVANLEKLESRNK